MCRATAGPAIGRDERGGRRRGERSRGWELGRGAEPRPRGTREQKRKKERRLRRPTRGAAGGVPRAKRRGEARAAPFFPAAGGVKRYIEPDEKSGPADTKIMKKAIEKRAGFLYNANGLNLSEGNGES